MSFQELEDENINKFSESGGSEQIENRVSGTLNAFRFIGTIFDLYLTRVRDTLLEMGKQQDAIEGPKKDDTSSEQ